MPSNTMTDVVLQGRSRRNDGNDGPRRLLAVGEALAVQPVRTFPPELLPTLD